MTHDGRSMAWMQTWHRLDHADDIRREAVGEDGRIDLPPEYWALLAEADVFSRLATAPASVGYETGEILDAKYQEQLEEQNRRREAVEKMVKARGDDMSCTCQFDESQCPIHNEGDEIEDDDGERST